MNDERDSQGRFITGNPGGPGRPSRPTEAAYLRELSNALTLDDWRAIVGRAVEDAKGGDAKAREWVSRYALGERPPTLEKLAEWEERGLTDDMLREARIHFERALPRQSTEENDAETLRALAMFDADDQAKRRAAVDKRAARAEAKLAALLPAV